MAGDTQGLSKHPACLDESILPFTNIRRLLAALVVGEDPCREIDDLEPSTGNERAVRLLEESRKVVYTAFDSTCMDEIKRLGEVPLELEVVDFEDAVWWNPRNNLVTYMAPRAWAWAWGKRDGSYHEGWMGLRSVPVLHEHHCPGEVILSVRGPTDYHGLGKGTASTSVAKMGKR